MTNEQAIKLLQHCRAEAHCRHFISTHNCDGCNMITALNMAIEALKDVYNCVHCEHYTEVETDTGIHGECKMDTAHRGDLISRQDAIDAVWKLDKDANEYVVDDAKEIHGYCTAIGVCVGELSALPSAEAVEVVRCKDCKNGGSDACPMFFEEWFTIDEGDGYVDDDYREHDYTTDEGYCHRGERREDGEA